jgi:hypothetical protein
MSPRLVAEVDAARVVCRGISESPKSGYAG